MSAKFKAESQKLIVKTEGVQGPPGPPGPPGAGAHFISADPNNQLTIGQDSGLFVPPLDFNTKHW